MNGPEPASLSALGRCLFKAVFAHLAFEMIHPFGDGNGRVGRLLELDILTQGGSVSALSLTSHYNENKNGYFQAIRAAEKPDAPGGVFAFVEFALEGLYAKSQEMVALIQAQTLDALWKDYVYESTDELRRRSAGRRTHTLALGLDTTARSYHQIRKLSPKLAVAYHEKSDGILSRTLKSLKNAVWRYARPKAGSRTRPRCRRSGCDGYCFVSVRRALTAGGAGDRAGQARGNSAPLESGA